MVGASVGTTVVTGSTVVPFGGVGDTVVGGTVGAMVVGATVGGTVVPFDGTGVTVVGATVGGTVVGESVVPFGDKVVGGGEIVVVGPSSGSDPFDVEAETPRAMPIMTKATRTTEPIRMAVFWFGVLRVQTLFLIVKTVNDDLVEYGEYRG